MRPIYIPATLLLGLASCDQKTTPKQEAVLLTVVGQPQPRPLPLADTTNPYTSLINYGDSTKPSRLVSINGGQYRVQASVLADSTRLLHYTYPASPAADADSTPSRTITGCEATYTFRLLRVDGKPQFVQQLRKSSFSTEVGQDLAVENDARPPVFLGYLPAFKALAFELSFYPPESDNGGEVLLLLDATTGRVLHQSLARWISGCNSPPVFAQDGQVLLTSFKILHANGRITKLDKPDRRIAGTLLVNNRTVLVVYMAGSDGQGNDLPLKGPNAELMDFRGRRLASFNLESIDGALGYQLLGKYVGQTRTYYLLDEENQQLGLISREHPTPVQILKLSQLPGFKAPQRPTEVCISFKPETGTNAAVYIDTVSGKLRYWLKKPGY